MNKQELIKKYENEWKEHSPFNETASYALMVKSFLDQLKKMDEPQKVTIPQFVADWIEQRKDEGWKLSQMFLQANLEEKYGRWIVDNQETFARAWLDGYEVEKELKYTVKIKSVNQYLVRNTDEDFLGFLQSRLKSKFTRKELEEAGLSDVFNSPLFEVEEVEG
jgi:uncharacterized protein YyaL (SSP411 family)